jgi:hypothetical protein
MNAPADAAILPPVDLAIARRCEPPPEDIPSGAPPLENALQAQLQAIAARPISARTLLELEKTARLGRELLAVAQDPKSVRRHRRLTDEDDDGDDGDDEGVASLVLNPYNPGNKAETFGATIVREAMASLSSLTSVFAPRAPEPSLTEIVTAIALAKRQGLTAVVTVLETQLRDRYDVTSPGDLSAIADVGAVSVESYLGAVEPPVDADVEVPS